MITVEDFRARFPEFASATAYPDGYLTTLIEEANRQISTEVFGVRADDALGLLTAHFLTITTGARASNAQTVSAGQASVTYFNTGVNDLQGSAYGLLFRRLVRATGGARVVVGLPGDTGGFFVGGSGWFPWDGRQF